MPPRTLSKSRFKLAVKCPTKVFYSLDKLYVSTKEEEEFLQALAEVQFDPARDRLRSVGDLVDRGPRSKDVA